MCLRIYRAPAGQDQRYPKLERAKEDGQKKKKDDQQQQQKKKDDKMEGIFASLASSLGQQDDGY